MNDQVNVQTEIDITEKAIKQVKQIKEERSGDVKIYIGDNSKITKLSGWYPKKSTRTTLEEIHKWIIDNKEMLKPVLS